MQPVLSPSNELLFQEFLRRYRELKAAKRLESIWFVSAALLGMLGVSSPWVFPDRGLIVAGIACVFLYLAIRRYIQQNKVVDHLSVNVHVLYHHLLGKLEVGFCTHAFECNCAEEFRRYVWQKYRISLYGGSPEERY